MTTPPSKRARDLDDDTPKSSRSFAGLTELLDQRFAKQATHFQGMLQQAKIEVLSTMNNLFDKLRRDQYAISEKVKNLVYEAN